MDAVSIQDLLNLGGSVNGLWEMYEFWHEEQDA